MLYSDDIYIYSDAELVEFLYEGVWESCEWPGFKNLSSISGLF